MVIRLLSHIALCLLLLLPFSECSKKESEGAHKQNAKEVVELKPAYGDIFIASSIGDASYLNPVLASDSSSASINSLVYNGLVKYDKDIKLEGELAEKWEVSRDGLNIIFHLRKGVQWHDGHPFTAEDVKFTYEKLIDPSIKTPYSSDYLLVKRFEILDPHTISVRYSEPFAPALESWGMGIIPKHIFEKGDFNSHPANRHPIGTGPFRFKDWKTDEKIVLEANSDYFEGRPYINRYIYRIIPDQAVQFLKLRNESIDSMGLTPDQYMAYKEFFTHYNKFRYPSFSYTYLGFNLRDPIFNRREIRHALAHALDKNDIIKGVLRGLGRPATGPFPPSSWAYNPDVKTYPYDPDKAKAMLKKFGWRYSDKKECLYNGEMCFEFTIMTNQGNKMRKLTAEIIQAHLEKIGIKVKIRIVEWSTFIHKFVDKGEFEAIIIGWGLGRDPDQYSIWHSSQIEEGQYNFIHYKNPEVDRLLEEGRRTFDIGKRREIYHKVHSIIAEDQPYIFLYYPESLPVVHKRFVGPRVEPIGLWWNFHKWFVPKGLQKYHAGITN